MYTIRMIPAGDPFFHDPRGPYEILDEDGYRIDFAHSRDVALLTITARIEETRSEIQEITQRINELEEEKASLKEMLEQFRDLRIKETQ